ncbi:formate/nitrite transporter family protein [Paenibacillus nanensis]|uniref:Formate/nitrite transporter family protein n=1 Tax=Paenibacillus nanensis TaxID=393251 RepID=A0A3A1UPJ4_9BACL|nr:formate/nitrite transporter family protein [Paenibacillus nanensis]RIX50487.1 formate/nitrite transporter family protein [Paenibacillus nanensis]
MSYTNPSEITQMAVMAGVRKATQPVRKQVLLGFAAGAFIALGFMLAIKVSAGVPAAWGGMNNFIGALVFPLGLILCLAAGGELLTGNMMAVPIAWYAGKINLRQWSVNWAVITIGNMAGAIFVAYVFGHLAGITEHGEELARTVALASAKLDEPFHAAFISGIGCNWLVSLAVWMSYGAKDGTGFAMSVWFPTMAFVALGFQHVVANMFLVPAAIFAGEASWSAFLGNFVPVFLGNAVGGGLFVGGLYAAVYLKHQ